MVGAFQEPLHIHHPYSCEWPSVDSEPLESIDWTGLDRQDCDSNSGSDFDDRTSAVFVETMKDRTEM